jgi:hypothetical protein
MMAAHKHINFTDPVYWRAELSPPSSPFLSMNITLSGFPGQTNVRESGYSLLSNIPVLVLLSSLVVN